MAGATTIVIVRSDLSIPGIVSAPSEDSTAPPSELSLFEAIEAKKPDVVVLDCRGPTHNGLAAIEKIRSFTTTPILVICEAGDPLQRDYEISGVAGCLQSPFDIQTFNALLLEIAGSSKAPASSQNHSPAPIRFNGIVFRQQDNTVASGDLKAQLTTMEARLLLHLLQKPWKVCSRIEMSDTLYGAQRPVSDRAIDAIVARLRKKLSAVLGDDGSSLIKTEFRHGFTFVGQLEGHGGI